jgi:trehalose synthase
MFYLDQYVPGGLDARAHVIPPAIDPLAHKNMAFSIEDAV